MANKVIIGILILLVVFTGGVGYYSYTLSQQIDQLSERLTSFEAEQTASVDSLSNELASLRTETLSKLGALEGQIGEALTEIDTLEGEIGAIENQIADIENEIGGVVSDVDALDARFSDAVNELSDFMIDAEGVYREVSQATVRINNGQTTVGSGFIFDNEGHVLTAQHVIDGLSPIFVIMDNGMLSEANIVGSCEFSDIAVLELEEIPDIEPLTLADSSQVKIGEPVVAIGSPLELRDTLTAGIISHTDRSAEIQCDKESRWVTNLIQFDAAVNFGNSGCPLANASGEVIGVVIARVSNEIGDGIYWAVSANKAKRVAEAIISQGFFEYPWVGILPADLTPQIAQDMGLETVNGVLVGGVFSDSPAGSSGIKGNDIIITINGMPVRDSSILTSYLGEFTSPGDVVTIGILRGIIELEISIELGIRE